jgi:hypothetical protein
MDVDTPSGSQMKCIVREVKLGCPKLSFQQKWRMECLEKMGLKIVLCHYGFFEH